MIIRAILYSLGTTTERQKFVNSKKVSFHSKVYLIYLSKIWWNENQL